MAGQKANPGQIETAALRRQQALTLRASGTRYRDIATALGVALSTAHEDVARALRDDAALHEHDVKTVRQLARERYRALRASLMPKALRGDLGAVDRVVKVDTREAELFGYDAPKQTEVSGIGGGPVEIVVTYPDEKASPK